MVIVVIVVGWRTALEDAVRVRNGDRHVGRCEEDGVNYGCF